MTTRSTVQQDHEKILRFLYQYKHMMTADIHYYLFPDSPRRLVERRMKQLLDQGLIDAYTLHQGRSGRNPRTFHLLLAGARRIGHRSLGNQHYRYERPDFRRFTLGLVELRHLAALHGWQLHEGEEECQQALYFFLTRCGVVQASLSMPARITPDLILCTDDGVVNILVRAHPLAGPSFWRERLRKYRQVLATCRGIAVVINKNQVEDARAALKRFGLEKRVLIADLELLRRLPTLVGRVKQSGEGEE